MSEAPMTSSVDAAYVREVSMEEMTEAIEAMGAPN